MNNEPKNAAEFQSMVKSLVSDAIWRGVPVESISVILAAEAEIVKSKK